MATQYSYNDAYSSPENEYHAEQLEKRLRSQVASFALLRFKRCMQMRMSLIDENK